MKNSNLNRTSFERKMRELFVDVQLISTSNELDLNLFDDFIEFEKEKHKFNSTSIEQKMNWD